MEIFFNSAIEGIEKMDLSKKYEKLIDEIYNRAYGNGIEL